ncbi:tetrahydromethanopterin S-methyltransferase subunit B [Methanothermococcus okinawensis]|uniref:Tetrahydromethanopterin S-methyltransferase subunit B n=1 Tax=Methanothermococcus okinawensis (strain DSM 14208 / JCM 11175 / IH1) TaxID=647113 RepID=F8AMT8_METOI|nr:tetrahydromethanopterin S-methyltransferase subunit B [Methanothermococcus okinawensis]AEH06922.1 Tetrahydromethanopterin S-methyltransferase subunit B [Methanothermococcus okinawensis IH1]
MAILYIDKEIPLVYNIENGKITKGLGDVIFVDTDPINQQIDRLEEYVSSYEQSLDPRYKPLKSYDNREGVYCIAGYFKPMFFGVWITLGIGAILALLMGIKF